MEQPITLEISTLPKESTLSTLKRLLQRAEADKPTTFVLADKIASHFVAAVLVTSVCVYSYWWFHSPEDAFWIVLSVLVVTCPCALSLATPTAITAATARLSQMGFLATRAHTIEGLRQVTDVVFDKTGTLTLGEFQLQETVAATTEEVDTLLALAAALESVSEHPIARAFHSQAKNPNVQELRIIANQGVEGTMDVDTVSGKVKRVLRIGKPEFAAPAGITHQQPDKTGQWVMLADQDQVLAWFRIEDQLRADADNLVRRLQQSGKRCHVLSGDSSGHAELVANNLGIGSVISNASPEDKLAFIRSLQESGAKVLMLGDGLNDAPVLAQAQVAVALMSGAALAQGAADMVLLTGRLSDLAGLIRYARRTLSIVKQNLAWAIGYNLAAIPLAMAGYVTPWMAAIGMSASSLLVVGNALRLAREPKVRRLVFVRD